MLPSRLVVFCDIDGVLADFYTSFSMLAHHFYGTPIFSNDDCYERSPLKQLLPKKSYQRLWRYIDTHQEWWLTIPRLPRITQAETDRLRQALHEHQWYFVTSRTGDQVVAYTKVWLFRNFGLLFPHVILAQDKGIMAARLQADVAIDDTIEILEQYATDSPTTVRYVMDAPYNRQGRPDGTHEVRTLGEFLDRLLEE
jgi:uncharacterized HAD superfamily protein